MPDAPRAVTAAPAPTVRLVNRRNQPVELHLGTDVRVLLPGAATAVDANQLATPQLAWLVAQRALVVQAAPPAPTEGPAQPQRAASVPAQPLARAKANAGKKTAPPASRAAAQPVETSSRAPSGAGRSAAKPASTKRASKGEKA